MENLDKKINEIFPGCVVRKDLVKEVKGNAIVPSYVLEYLLGQYCATNDESTIIAGIESVKEILAKHYVNRNEAEYIKSTIKEKGRYKVIDKVSVQFNEKTDSYIATMREFMKLDEYIVTKVLIQDTILSLHLWNSIRHLSFCLSM